jgi:hypothetical protein
MDTTVGSASQGGARAQPANCPTQKAPSRQSQPLQNTARGPVQPHRHALGVSQVQDRALPTPPLSRSNSNTTVVNAVRRGDERVSHFDSS